MTAHVRYTAVDDLPGTLSKKIMTDLLRGQMGFEGLAVTDCMEMDAVRATYGCGEGAVMAVEAGCDMLTFSHTLASAAEAVEALYAAVESGRITEERIDASYNRIMRLKEKYGLLKPLEIDRARAHTLAADPQKNDLHRRLSRESMTLMWDRGGLEAFRKARRPLFLAPPSLSLTGAEDREVNPLSFVKIAVQEFDGSAVTLPLNCFDDTVQAQIDQADFDVAVMCLYNARFRSGQVETLRYLEKLGRPLVVIMLGAPYDTGLVHRADALVAAYEYTNLSVPALIDALKTGTFAGRLPVRL